MEIRLAIRFVLLLSFVTPLSAWTQESCGPALIPEYSSDPMRFAETWLAHMERLYGAIPNLSPREQEWLEAELTSADNLTLDDIAEGADARRPRRAMRSTTYAIREAKRNSGSLLAALRVLTGRLAPADSRSASQEWAFFTYSLIDEDASLHLARLEAEEVIERTDMPADWTILAAADMSLRESIRSRRVSLARHVLMCIMPQVIAE